VITASNVRNGVFAFLVLAVIAAESIQVFLPDSLVVARLLRVLWLLLAATVVVWVLDATILGAALRFGALNDLARRLSHPIDLQSILDAGLQHSMRLLEAEAACVRLFDGADLAVASSVNVDPAYLADHLHLEPDGIVRDILERQEPTPVAAASVPPEVGGLLPEGRARYVVLVPLISKGSVLGMMTLLSRRRLPAIKTELETLRAIGTEMGIAIANREAFEGLLRESRTDPLTGVGSRRHFEDLHRREVARARRNQRPISMAMIDVDNFKEINDHWGHPTGDLVLQEVAKLLLGLRAGDVVARYGGDEFVIMMTDSAEEQAVVAVERIRERLHDLNASQLFPFSVQLSIGVRQMQGLEDDLVAEADRAMYEEKRRKRVERVVSTQPARESEESDPS